MFSFYLKKIYVSGKVNRPSQSKKQQKGQVVRFPAAVHSELSCARHVDSRVKVEEPVRAVACSISPSLTMSTAHHRHSLSVSICPLLSLVTLSSASPRAVLH